MDNLSQFQWAANRLYSQTTAASTPSDAMGQDSIAGIQTFQKQSQIQAIAKKSGTHSGVPTSPSHAMKM